MAKTGSRRRSKAPARDSKKDKAAASEPVDEERVMTTTDEVRQCEKSVRASRAAANLLPSLLATLEQAEDPEVVHVASWAMLRLCSEAMARGDLFHQPPSANGDDSAGCQDSDGDRDDQGEVEQPRARKRAKLSGSADSGVSSTSTSEAIRVYQGFLRVQYVRFLHGMYRHLAGSVASLQLTALNVLMRVVVLESEQRCAQLGKAPELRSDVLSELVRTLVTSGNLSSALLSRFLDRYVQAYGDVQQHVWVRLRRVCSEDVLGTSAEARRTILLLLKRSAPSLTTMLTERLVGVSDADDDTTRDIYTEGAAAPSLQSGRAAGSKKKKKKRQRGESAATMAKRRAYSDAWLAFLRLNLPRDVYKDVLSQLHTLVLPFMPRPAALIDFLSDSFNVGGVVSLLALNGIFMLITKHNLNYPEFYPKLYSLLTPNAMHSRYRPRFIQLVDLFLTSSHLPSYLVAAFAKRLARLTLTAPPAATLALIPLVYNLLVRHPHCMYLIHRQASKASPLDFSSSSDAPASDEQADITGKPDGFDMSVDNPVDSGVAFSSMWELATMFQHNLPAAARLSRILEGPMRKQAYKIDDFIGHTYASLFDSEVYRRTDGSPLEYRRPVGGILDPAAFSTMDMSL